MTPSETLAASQSAASAAHAESQSQPWQAAGRASSNGETPTVSDTALAGATVPDGSTSPAAPDEELIAILAPTGRDADLACAVLERDGLRCHACADTAELCRHVAFGLGAVLLAEEALSPGELQQLQAALSGQPPWSDLPLVVLTSGGQARRSSAATGILRESFGNTTLLERPLRAETLVSTLQVALRARRRQYEVRDLLQQMETGVRQRDEFLAMLGHELRNPLGTIRTAVELLREVGAADPQAMELRAVIERQSQHLKHLIDDLLDVARVTQGKIQLQRAPVDLNELSRRCTQSIALSEGGRDHEVLCTPASRPVLVEGDEVRLEQILNNLLTNAVKYTPSGGRIQTIVETNGDEAVLRVRDTGVGIEPELLGTVFDLFTQSQRALDRSQGGLGIGLTVTRSLVKLHGGQISVFSAGRGQGCEFVVRLPLLQPSAPSRDTVRDAGTTAASGGCRILIIEDNLDARDMLQMFLKLQGHHVDVAGDGAQGVADAVALRSDVALVDIGLPGLNGYEVAQQLRAQLDNHIYLIALTGYGQPDDRVRALQAGFDMHLTKPVDLDQLTEALAQVTQRCS